jgi:hypothetical protein
MNWKGCGRKQLWSNFRYYPGTCLEELRRTTKKSSQARGLSGQRFKPGSSRIRSRTVNHSAVTFGDDREEKKVVRRVGDPVRDSHTHFHVKQTGQTASKNETWHQKLITLLLLRQSFREHMSTPPCEHVSSFQRGLFTVHLVRTAGFLTEIWRGFPQNTSLVADKLGYSHRGVCGWWEKYCNEFAYALRSITISSVT